jgi:hypothetical protein
LPSLLLLLLCRSWTCRFFTTSLSTISLITALTTHRSHHAAQSGNCSADAPPHSLLNTLRSLHQTPRLLAETCHSLPRAVAWPSRRPFFSFCSSSSPPHQHNNASTQTDRFRQTRPVAQTVAIRPAAEPAHFVWTTDYVLAVEFSAEGVAQMRTGRAMRALGIAKKVR